MRAAAPEKKINVYVLFGTVTRLTEWKTEKSRSGPRKG
jgi:hypothetical protein